MSRAVRLLYIVDLLRDEPHTVEELADKCNVATRTIYKDLQDLQGEPLYKPLVLRVRREWSMMGGARG